MMRIAGILLLAALLSATAGCRSIKTMLNPPEKKEKTVAAEKTREHRSPTDVLPFASKQKRPPSMLAGSLTPAEQEALRQFEREADGERPALQLGPDVRVDATDKAQRSWVFGR